MHINSLHVQADAAGWARERGMLTMLLDLWMRDDLLFLDNVLLLLLWLMRLKVLKQLFLLWECHRACAAFEVIGAMDLGVCVGLFTLLEASRTDATFEGLGFDVFP